MAYTESFLDVANHVLKVGGFGPPGNASFGGLVGGQFFPPFRALSPPPDLWAMSSRELFGESWTLSSASLVAVQQTLPIVPTCKSIGALHKYARRDSNPQSLPLENGSREITKGV